MDKGRYVQALAALVAVALVAVGCGSSSSSSSDGGSTSGGGGESLEGKTVSYDSAAELTPYLTTYDQMNVEGLEKAGATVKQLKSPFETAVDVRNCATSVSEDPDLIISAPIEPNALVPCYREAQQRGIPVIVVQQTPQEPWAGLVTTVIGQKAAQAGQMIAQKVVEGLEAEGRKEGNILVVNAGDGVPTAKTIWDTFAEEIAKTPYKIVAEGSDPTFTPTKTAAVAQPLFAKYSSQGGIQAAVSATDEQVNALIQAAEQVGEKVGVENDGLIASGVECYAVGVKNILAGKEYSTLTQGPTKASRTLIPYAEKVLRGEEVPSSVLIPYGPVDKTNVKQAEAEGECP